jgi:hypothetical protein
MTDTSKAQEKNILKPYSFIEEIKFDDKELKLFSHLKDELKDLGSLSKKNFIKILIAKNKEFQNDKNADLEKLIAGEKLSDDGELFFMKAKRLLSIKKVHHNNADDLLNEESNFKISEKSGEECSGFFYLHEIESVYAPVSLDEKHEAFNNKHPLVNIKRNEKKEDTGSAFVYFIGFRLNKDNALSAENMVLYRVGKWEKSNVMERLMQHVSNLFGGYYPIINQEHFKKHNFQPRIRQLELLRESLEKAILQTSGPDILVNSGIVKQFENTLLHTSDSLSSMSLLLDALYKQPKIKSKNRRLKLLRKTMQWMKENLFFAYVKFNIKENAAVAETTLHHLLGLNCVNGKTKTWTNSTILSNELGKQKNNFQNLKIIELMNSSKDNNLRIMADWIFQSTLLNPENSYRFCDNYDKSTSPEEYWWTFKPRQKKHLTELNKMA